MTKFTQSQIQDKARQLVEKHVVQSIQDLIDFVNTNAPELISELVSDAVSSQEVDQEEMFAYLCREHNEELIDLLEGWYLNEDNEELVGKELLDAYHDDPDMISEEIEELFLEKHEQDQPEILQFVQLSNDWIARKLRDQGEIVIELLGLDIWCRQCFGQAFYIDPCWEALATEELEKYGLDN